MPKEKPTWCNSQKLYESCNIKTVKDCGHCEFIKAFYDTEQQQKAQEASYRYSEQFLQDYPESVVDIDDLENAFQAGAKYALENLV